MYHAINSSVSNGTPNVQGHEVYPKVHLMYHAIKCIQQYTQRTMLSSLSKSTPNVPCYQVYPTAHPMYHAIKCIQQYT